MPLQVSKETSRFRTNQTAALFMHIVLKMLPCLLLHFKRSFFSQIEPPLPITALTKKKKSYIILKLDAWFFLTPIYLRFCAYTIRLPFHNACFALAVQVSDPRKIEQPLLCTSSTHVVALLQFASTNPPYCWVSCSKKSFPKHSGFHIFIGLLIRVIPQCWFFDVQCFRVTSNGHSGCSSKGSFETDPKVQFCLHNILRDCKDCAAWLSWCCCVFQVFRFMTEDEICTSSNWMFLLCSERERFLWTFIICNCESRRNELQLSCVFFLLAGRIHVLFTVWGMTFSKQ